MRTVRWTFVIAILLCLLPIISTALGEFVANAAGCPIVELGFGKCLVRGHDINDALASLELMTPLSIWGVLAALVAGLTWAVSEIVAATIGRSSRRLRF